jgi:hypothetical protein
MISNQTLPSSDNFNNNQNNSIINNINNKNSANEFDVEFDFAMCHGYYDCWRYRVYC